MKVEEHNKLQKQEEMSTRGHIDRSHMMVVGTYFEGIDDFMNVEMVNRRYRGMTGMYKYNPVVLNDERSREMFSGLETQHLYSEEDRACQRARALVSCEVR